jgi:protease I
MKEIARMLQGKRITILAEEDFEDSELIEPLRAMKDAGAIVLILGSGSKKTYRGKRGSAEATVDATADKVEASQFDAIIVPGGYAPDKMRLHQPMARDGNIITPRKPADLPKFNKAIIDALL